MFYYFISVTVNFIDRDGDTMSIKAKIGDSLLDVAKDNDVDLEGEAFKGFYAEIWVGCSLLCSCF